MRPKSCKTSEEHLRVQQKYHARRPCEEHCCAELVVDSRALSMRIWDGRDESAAYSQAGLQGAPGEAP